MDVILICLIVCCSVLLYEVVYPYLEKVAAARKEKNFTGIEPYYRKIIAAGIRYFHRLTPEEQHRFLYRTYLFHRSKKFHYVGVEASAEMPVLISAVAIQLTFGLEKFSLNYFQHIFVLEHDYHYGYYSLPFMGHVDNTGIYLSWDNFLLGLKHTSDSSNVGLHEMAHALTYVNFITKTEEDKHFKLEFKNFSAIARPIFQDMQKGKRTMLGDYAATNYHEFWAVCVEMFFGNPVRFRHELPQLYAALAKVLRQDTLVS